MRARTDEFVRFGEHLARHTELGDATARGLAMELQIPYTTVVEWWRHLEFQRALLVAHRDVRVDRPRLLQVLTADRISRLTPSSTRTITSDARGVVRALERANVPYALGMLSAANEWAFFEPRRSVQLYVPRQALASVRDLLPPDADGSVHLEIFRENLAHLPTQRRGGAVVTSAFQTLLDCRAHPEGGAHAAFLESQVMRWEGS